MTTPTQDRDITATLSAPREPTAEALEAAAARLLEGSVREFMGRSSGDKGAYWRISYGISLADGPWWWHHGGNRSVAHFTAEGALIDLLRHHPELWPAEPDETAPEPQPLTVAAREALRLVVRAGPEASPSEWDDSESCCICSEPWPCEVEQACRILADALDTDTEAGAAALAAFDSLEATR
jgi:hypothetical protein